LRVAEVDAAATHDLRRRVLRRGDPGVDVTFPEDARDGAFHLAALDDGGAVVGVGTFFPEPYDGRPAYRLRGMAVEPARQGSGAGRAVLDAGIARCRDAGAEILWANARDTALGFYGRAGMTVVGDGFDSIGIPHHVVVLELGE
jgi:GNAT superfamily N-acetyltransferase